MPCRHNATNCPCSESKAHNRLQKMCVSSLGGLKASPASFFSGVEPAPPDAIFGIKDQYKKDTAANKINLSVGAYRDNNGKPYILDVVRKAEELLLQDKSLNKEYLGIDGHVQFRKRSAELIFGKDSKSLRNGSIATLQCLSGTGSLRVGFEFLAQFLPRRTTVYTSIPTWGNQNTVAGKAGFKTKGYRYWDAKGKKLDIEGMLADIGNAPRGSIILLHACAHNPTGVDPTPSQWRRICATVKSKGHFPFIDAAYQGFATGSLENDSQAIRLFESQGMEFVVAQSYAKNFGLYGERAGCLHIVTESSAAAKAILTHAKKIIRPMYSNPPKHGAEIVELVLRTPQLFARWKEEIKLMSDRIKAMRAALKGHLDRLGTPGNWDHITSQIGMFSFTGLTKKQCRILMDKHSIYLLTNGRISMAGLNTGNIERFATSVDAAVRATQ